ncbi:MAG: hypothetical protein Tsb0034_14860 [Ekhidna sp.]
MTNLEYDIIDELYFVTSYHDVKQNTGFDDATLKGALIKLLNDGLIRVYTSVDEASELEDVNMDAHFQSYYYLASKKGLFEHNMR